MRLRGSVLVVSTNIEAILMLIIYYSNVKQYKNPHKSPSLKLKNLTFGGKIKRTKDLISEHHPDLAEKYIDLFNNLNEFLDIRNKLSHHAIFWLDDKFEKFKMWEVKSNAKKFEFYSPVEYKRSELSDSINNCFNKISNPLVSLAKEVESRLKKNHPQIYPLLSGALEMG